MAFARPSSSSSSAAAPHRWRRLAAAGLLLVAALAGAFLLALREDPRWSLRLLAVGLQLRSATVVGCTMDARRVFTGLAQELTAAPEAMAPATTAAGLQQRLKRTMLQIFAPQLPTVLEGVLHAYITAGASGVSLLLQPLRGMLGIDQAMLEDALKNAWMGAFLPMDSGALTQPGPDPAPPASAVTIHLPKGQPGIKLVAVMERGPWCWRVVGLSGLAQLVPKS